MQIRTLVLLAVVLVACGGASTTDVESGDGCDAAIRAVRDRAVRMGYDGDGDGVPDAKGVCDDSSVVIRRDFGADCDRLARCR
jgi:hypothetical protein